MLSLFLISSIQSLLSFFLKEHSLALVATVHSLHTNSILSLSITTYKMLAHLALVALAALPSATAFGPVGSQAVALVAQNFMTAKTLKAVNKMLGGDSSVALVNAATYGSKYSATPEGAWSTAGFSMCQCYPSQVHISNFSVQLADKVHL